MSNECGHTDAEHKEETDRFTEAIQSGDISVLVPTLSNEHLMMVLQMATVETLIRSENMEQAARNWQAHDELVLDLFKSESETLHPKEWASVRQANREFIDDVAAGRPPRLSGAPEAPEPVEEVESFRPGNYL